MIRDEKAATLIKDQRDKIDDLTSKLQRVYEENKAFVSKIDIMSQKGLGEGITSDNEKIKELENRLEQTKEYVNKYKNEADLNGEEITTLLALNERLMYQLGQAKEVNEDCDKEIDDLKLKIKEGTRIQS